ncbi:MAG: hypothetical protein A2Y10_12535 [Planctomycetes bacterium GWF2_41_51]|nr:MAG: hypothetical protein A2Y10_12535 [Planctomycetes bacterium GWF2_41_51]
MTTDAKIGLLLALVFIVAITFVINGLPDFLNKKDKADVTSNYISQYNRPDEPGIVDRSSREAAALLNKKMVSPPAAAAVETNNIQTTSYQTILPAASEVVKSSLPESTASAATTVIETLPVQTSPVPASAIIETAEPAKTGETVYEVTDGDSLAFIAQKFYGQQAGNKYANIQKIYEANKKTMKSINELHVGQKLVIPALSDKEQSLIKTGLFEKVETPSTKPTAAAESKKFKEYVVKEQDTLWKIAAKYLGDGGRFMEIAELNKTINPDNLITGTKIKLPAK